MNKKVRFLLVLILLECLLLSHPAYSIQEKVNSTIKVNPNLELFSVVYILAFNGSSPFIIAPQDYINDVLTYFAPYKNHEAVKYVRKVFNDSLPYYYGDNSIGVLSSRLVMLSYLPNETNLGDLKPLAEFANESNFMEFYKAHEGEYARYTSSIAPYLERVPEMHEKFFGFTYREYNVELSYLLRIHPHAIFRGEKAYSIGYAYPNYNIPRAYTSDLC